MFQMLNGATDLQRKEWKMTQGQGFAWLPESGKTLEGECSGPWETFASVVGTRL